MNEEYKALRDLFAALGCKRRLRNFYRTREGLKRNAVEHQKALRIEWYEKEFDEMASS